MIGAGVRIRLPMPSMNRQGMCSVSSLFWTLIIFYLLAVEKHAGSVELQAEPEPGKRGILTEVISLVVDAYSILKEKWLYEPVKNYSATVHYRQSSGNITKVVFTHK